MLPDEKDNQKDIVVFTDEAHATGAEEEALQLGALAALHRVAGDRAMHRILPAHYLPAWERHGQDVSRIELTYHSPPPLSTKYN